MIRLRRAVPKDASEVAAVFLRSRHASRGRIPRPVHTDDDVRAWIADVMLPTSETWVADDDGRVVAMLVLGADDWLEHLYVDPARTGRGIGAQLLDVAKTRRPRGLQLWTFETNVDARRFYERHGFVAVEATDGSGNEERSPDVRYRWPGEASGAVAPAGGQKP